ncbi:hypothetical protein [Histidinibacterium aquaticum]|uniref:Uncharacterized protein n=1 Tax=Histidinibacterium aquaticum TaxID=2613962 RepID=A0A5J5GNN9_9RHOB|nr:hypothetical protein [Histidinibacterium aquaticum]KAA9009919.1 hypothetical protein F3S47_01225 [Histidinibacterium aquaticum]
MARFIVILVVSMTLSGCRVDSSQTARATTEAWLYPGEEVFFNASPYCAVAVYRLTRNRARGTLYHVSDVDRALWHVGQGHAVAIHMAGRSPNDFSRAMMSKDLPKGLGLLSSATGPRECMPEHIARGVFAVLMTPGAWTIYDPGGNALVLADFDRGLAVFMRGNV